MRLHDAQSCVAREYGFPSWSALRRQVEDARGLTISGWLRLVYSGDSIGGTHAARPAVAARWIGLLDVSDPYLACAVGDIATVRQAATADAGWVRRPGGPLDLPPLVAVTHSSLSRLPEFAPGLRECASLLLDAGADPDQSFTSPDGHRLTALYGAAGVTHDPELSAVLLEAGADPDDGESLYHSLGRPECTRLLLAAGATVTGTNAMYAVSDHDDVGVLQLLLDHGGDPNEPSLSWGTPLLFAIRRRRPGHVRLLLADDPGVVATLDDDQRRLLPDLAAAGAADAVRLMVETGWPIDTPGGDWQATALNHAVFRGDAGLTRFLLDHGADPTVRNGFSDTVVGTLSWASLNNEQVRGDWVGCAQALLDNGVRLPEDYSFSDDVRALLPD